MNTTIDTEDIDPFGTSPFGRVRAFRPVLTGELLELTQKILRAQGRQRYLTDWDKALSAQVVSRAVPADGVLLNPRPGRPELRLQVTRVPARRTRRLDYTRLRNEHSDLYAQLVTETTPPVPLRLTFRATAQMTKSTQWDALRSEGWLAMDNALGERRAASAEWRSLSDIATQIREVRDRCKASQAAEAAARGDLATAILELTNGQTDIIWKTDSDDGDGRLFTPAAPVTRRADLDAVEAHPVARRYVRSSVAKESTRVWFQAVGEDPEGDQDPFEGW